LAAALLPRKIFTSVSGTHFCYRLGYLQGLVHPERLEIIHFFGLKPMTFLLVAEFTTIPRAPTTAKYGTKYNIHSELLGFWT
jgi:hypothetical protein